MRTIVKFGLVAGLVVLALWVIGGDLWPTYHHSYKLICEVEVDGETHTGSSVFEVTWQAQPAPATAWSTNVSGDAVFVDLGDRGALLIPNQILPDTGVPAEPLRYLALVAFSDKLSMSAKYGVESGPLTKLGKLKASKVLPNNKMPQFIWLKDVQDQASAQIIHPSQFAQVIGGNASLKSLTIKMTKERPSQHTLEKKLPWLLHAADVEREYNFSHSFGIYQLRAKDLIGHND